MRRAFIAVLLLVAATVGAVSRLDATINGVTLAVPGRSNQTPWAAALGPFVAVAWGAQPADGALDVFVSVSRDSGQTFGAPVRVNDIEGEARLGGELPPRVALVARSGGEVPEIVVAYGSKTTGTAIKVSRSTDGGRTFSSGRQLQAPGAAGDRGWHALTIDREGVAHVMWLDHRGMASGKPESHEHHEAAAMDGATMAQRSGLYYAQDSAGMQEREVLKGVCYCCKVALTTGAEGALIAAWRHVYAGNIRDIAFTISRDGGRTFAAPQRLSEDRWQLAGCPDDGPALAVDGSGVIHAVWPTVIGGDTPEGAIFYASSRDGRSFSPRTRVPTLGSPKPMHPQIVTVNAGQLAVAWDEVIGGVRQASLRTMRFDEAGKPIFGAPMRLGSPDEPSSYPILLSTPTGVLAVFVEGKAGASSIQVASPPGLRASR
jgi:hypothetical protein